MISENAFSNRVVDKCINCLSLLCEMFYNKLLQNTFIKTTGAGNNVICRYSGQWAMATAPAVPAKSSVPWCWWPSVNLVNKPRNADSSAGQFSTQIFNK